ncbi:MAG: protein kinase [Caldilineaceae bacterium]
MSCTTRIVWIDLISLKRFALKVLKPESMAWQACWPASVRGRVLTQLQHPGILRVYETGMDDGRMYTAMELIDGHSFDAYLAGRKKLTITEAIYVARQVAEALDYLHRNGYAARDIKPANLMLEDSGRIVLFDFGTVFRINDGVDYESGVFGTCNAWRQSRLCRRNRSMDAPICARWDRSVPYMTVGRKPL